MKISDLDTFFAVRFVEMRFETCGRCYILNADVRRKEGYVKLSYCERRESERCGAEEIRG